MALPDNNVTSPLSEIEELQEERSQSVTFVASSSGAQPPLLEANLDLGANRAPNAGLPDAGRQPCFCPDSCAFD